MSIYSEAVRRNDATREVMQAAGADFGGGGASGPLEDPSRPGDPDAPNGEAGRASEPPRAGHVSTILGATLRRGELPVAPALYPHLAYETPDYDRPRGMGRGDRALVAMFVLGIAGIAVGAGFAIGRLKESRAQLAGAELARSESESARLAALEALHAERERSDTAERNMAQPASTGSSDQNAAVVAPGDDLPPPPTESYVLGGEPAGAVAPVATPVVVRLEVSVLPNNEVRARSSDAYVRPAPAAPPDEFWGELPEISYEDESAPLEPTRPARPAAPPPAPADAPLARRSVEPSLPAEGNAGGHVLEGVFWSEDDPMAIIDGEVVGVGGRVGDLVVKRIERNSAVVEVGGRTFTLK